MLTPWVNNVSAEPHVTDAFPQECYNKKKEEETWIFEISLFVALYD